jgi:hypothetical protein
MAIDRVRFFAHPIADSAFNFLAIALFDADKRFLHEWTSTRLEFVRDAIIYNILGFVEIFVYGLLLGIAISGLCELMIYFVRFLKS